MPESFPVSGWVTHKCLKCIFLKSSAHFNKLSFEETVITFSLIYGLKSINSSECLVKFSISTGKTG